MMSLGVGVQSRANAIVADRADPEKIDGERGEEEDESEHWSLLDWLRYGWMRG